LTSEFRACALGSHSLSIGVCHVYGLLVTRHSWGRFRLLAVAAATFVVCVGLAAEQASASMFRVAGIRAVRR
jgi:hypothetical protein